MVLPKKRQGRKVSSVEKGEWLSVRYRYSHERGVGDGGNGIYSSLRIRKTAILAVEEYGKGITRLHLSFDVDQIYKDGEPTQDNTIHIIGEYDSILEKLRS